MTANLRAVPALNPLRRDEGPSGPGQSPPFRGIVGETDVLASPAESSLPEDITRALTLWELRVAGTIDQATLERESHYIAQGLPICESCRLRCATINDGGWRTCASCHNGGRR